MLVQTWMQEWKEESVKILLMNTPRLCWATAFLVKRRWETKSRMFPHHLQSSFQANSHLPLIALQAQPSKLMTSKLRVVYGWQNWAHKKFNSIKSNTTDKTMRTGRDTPNLTIRKPLKVTFLPNRTTQNKSDSQKAKRLRRKTQMKLLNNFWSTRLRTLIRLQNSQMSGLNKIIRAHQR